VVSTQPSGRWVGEDGKGDFYDRVQIRWRDLAAQWGWRPSTRRQYLPRKVADTGWMGQEPWGYPVCDHPRRWIDRHGRPLVTFEPYTDHRCIWGFSRSDGEKRSTIPGFVAECERRGLVVEINGLSPYYPGRTSLLIIGPKVDYDDSDRPFIGPGQLARVRGEA
jgi:hypothetical protein